MKTVILALCLLASIAAPLMASAEVEYNCEQSAVNYIVSIANAPYPNEKPVDASDLIQVARSQLGDGAEAYELFEYKLKDSSNSFELKLYVEEIGGICPLEKFSVKY